MTLFSWPRNKYQPRNIPIAGTNLELREPTLDDYQQWKILRESSRNFLTPWEPLWPSDDLTKMGYRRRMRHIERERNNATGRTYFIRNHESDKLLGGISVMNLRRGAARSCTIGYWMGEQYAGQGIMKHAIKALAQNLLWDMNLERIEAACLPNNERSIKLLEKCGFRFEGILRNYLEINGTRQDHRRYSLTRQDLE